FSLRHVHPPPRPRAEPWTAPRTAYARAWRVRPEEPARGPPGLPAARPAQAWAVGVGGLGFHELRAEFAALGHLATADPRVKSRVRPLNLRAFGHVSTSFLESYPRLGQPLPNHAAMSAAVNGMGRPLTCSTRHAVPPHQTPGLEGRGARPESAKGV